MGRVEKILRDISTYLLILITLLILIGSFLPHPSTFSELQISKWKGSHPFLWILIQYLHPSNFILTPPFIAIIALLNINLLFCTFMRIKRWGKRKKPPHISHFNSLKAEWKEIPFFQPEDLKRKLKRKGWFFDWEVSSLTSSYFRFRKGVFGFHSSILFHLSLFFITLTGIFSYLTGFKGEIILEEEMQKFITEKSFIKVYRLPRIFKPPSFQVTLNRCGIYTDSSGNYDYYSILTFKSDDEEKRGEILINRTLKFKGFNFVLRRMGFSTRFILEDKNGNKIFDSYVNLMILNRGDEDYFSIFLNPPLHLRLKLIEFNDEKGKVLFNLEVQKEKEKIFSSQVKPYESYRFEEFLLKFAGIKKWASFNVVREPFFPLLAITMFLTVFFSLMRFVDPEILLYIIANKKENNLKFALFSRESEINYNLIEDIK